MRRKKLVIFGGIGVTLLVVALIGGFHVYRIIQGNVVLAGPVEAIPSKRAPLSPPKKGAADWPRWRGAAGDGFSASRGIRTDWTGGLKKLWEVNFLCQGDSNATWSTPVVQGNRLIVPGRDATRDLVFCLNPDTGEILWLGAYEAKTGTNYGPGSRATACIDEDRVYTFGRGGDLVCWALADGRLLWRKNVKDAGGKEPQWGHSSSPLALGDKVFIQAGGSAHTVAYNKMTGALAWKTTPGDAGYAALTCMGSAGKQTLLSFRAAGLMGLDPATGKTLWSTPWTTSYDVNATTPTVSGDTVFITSGYDTGCQAVKVGPTGPTVLWKNKAIASQHSDPVIVGGFVYGFSGQSGQNKGFFKCLELATGTERWSSGEIGWGTLAGVDGHLVTLDIKGNLFLVKPSPAGFRKVAEFRGALGTVGAPAWTAPVIANGRLYVRYLQRLICYDLTGK